MPSGSAQTRPRMIVKSSSCRPKTPLRSAAFSGDSLCYVRISQNQRRFDQMVLPLPEGKEIRTMVGLTDNRRAVVTCTDGTVYAISLPN